MKKFIILKVDEQKAVASWFNWINADKQKGQRARLRRCSTLDEILMQQGFYRLCQPLPRLEPHALTGLTLVAGLLVWIKAPVETALSEQLGKGNDKPAFSELRFQRLLASEDPHSFFQSMRRAIIQAGETVNHVLLADEILHWYQQYRHPGWYTGSRQWQYRFAKPYYARLTNF